MQYNRAVKIPEELALTAEEAVKMYKKKGENLTRNGNFGVDVPLAVIPDLMESREAQLFYANLPT